MYRPLRLLQIGKLRLGDAPARTVGAPGRGSGAARAEARVSLPPGWAQSSVLPAERTSPPTPHGRPPPAGLRTRGLPTLPSAGYFSAAQEVRGGTGVRNGTPRQAGTSRVTAGGEGRRGSPGDPQPPGLRTRRGVPVCKGSLAEARVSTRGTRACGGCPRALTGQARAGIVL